MQDLTEAQIRSFQQSRGLTATGKIDEVTRRALEEAQWKLGDRSLNLQEPPLMRGDDVAALQSRLTEMGFDCGRVDGIYGARSAAAVK
jgi:N-acetylmuramoyl-L-alanine amidase